VKYYITSTETTAACVRQMLQLTFPEEAERYERAFKAAQTLPYDQGPWLGRVVVWKLQVDMHVDKLDDGPTLSFCSGRFKGGNLYLPDLGLKFW
jgi:hypothetical protein